ncbi:N-acetylmuramoyl-L-alanine amidase [Streptomyces hoynatensis]|uniref:N-acetylmuramoyl-L-alanine amidase n=1 Tax=Streptomyces hoynatensis TaxID=1141874 RepID=A0A3A9YVS9_9ACTN|nr:peptidoglycan recognition family protein [Streptomyces hoynatensis]RKN40020.1 N-acetylmuramoyl-L-alanine amidase [Streptomyces hoynatensis]
MADPHARQLPTRRALLRGSAAFAAVAATASASAARAAAEPTTPGRRAGGVRPLDYPLAEWTPASFSNFTVANRPSQYPIEYVVIHVTQETFADTLAIFQDPSAAVSSHYVVGSADGRVAQCVEERNVAWHAGNWSYNTRSIGIEHEGWVDEPEWFTDAMYEKSARLTAYVCDAYGIPKNRTHIIGHSEVPGATHTDPGPLWDWDRYLGLVKAA